MILTLFITICAAIATGVFAWLFFEHFSERLIEVKDSVSMSTLMRFSEMFLFIDVSRYFKAYIALIIILPILVALLSEEILLGIGTLLALFAVPPLLIKSMTKRRLKKIEQQLPDALMMISSSLKAGASLSSAIDNLIRESPAPISQEFGLMLRERKLGVDLDTALSHLEQRIPLEDFSLSISAIRISREVGGNLAETLESLAETIRKKLSMEGKIDSLTAQGKLQGIVMSSLPILLVGVLMKVEPDAMGMLFTTKLGWAVLLLILAMQFLGFIAIRKITTIDV